MTWIRLAIWGLAAAGAGVWLWNIHDAMADRRVRTAVDILHVKHRAQEARRLASATAYRNEIDALTARNVALKAQVKTHVTNDPRCAWNADAVRLLNAARGYGSVTAGQPSYPLPRPAPSSRAPDRSGSGGGRH